MSRPHPETDEVERLIDALEAAGRDYGEAFKKNITEMLTIGPEVLRQACRSVGVSIMRCSAEMRKYYFDMIGDEERRHAYAVWTYFARNTTKLKSPLTSTQWETDMLPLEYFSKTDAQNSDSVSESSPSPVTSSSDVQRTTLAVLSNIQPEVSSAESRDINARPKHQTEPPSSLSEGGISTDGSLPEIRKSASNDEGERPEQQMRVNGLSGHDAGILETLSGAQDGGMSSMGQRERNGLGEERSVVRRPHVMQHLTKTDGPLPEYIAPNTADEGSVTPFTTMENNQASGPHSSSDIDQVNAHQTKPISLASGNVNAPAYKENVNSPPSQKASKIEEFDTQVDEPAPSPETQEDLDNLVRHLPSGTAIVCYLPVEDLAPSGSCDRCKLLDIACIIPYNLVLSRSATCSERTITRRACAPCRSSHRKCIWGEEFRPCPSNDSHQHVALADSKAQKTWCEVPPASDEESQRLKALTDVVARSKSKSSYINLTTPHTANIMHLIPDADSHGQLERVDNNTPSKEGGFARKRSRSSSLSITERRPRKQVAHSHPTDSKNEPQMVNSIVATETSNALSDPTRGEILPGSSRIVSPDNADVEVTNTDKGSDTGNMGSVPAEVEDATFSDGTVHEASYLRSYGHERIGERSRTPDVSQIPQPMLHRVIEQALASVRALRTIQQGVPSKTQLAGVVDDTIFPADDVHSRKGADYFEGIIAGDPVVQQDPNPALAGPGRPVPQKKASGLGPADCDITQSETEMLRNLKIERRKMLEEELRKLKAELGED